MKWLGMLALLWLQIGCTPSHLRCDAALRPINGANGAAPSAVRHPQGAPLP
jgi:hypothetical protein